MRQNRRGRNRGMMRKPMGAKGFDNGGDVRVRGNVHQLLDRYLQLARDAGSAGDRIAAENYLQHAEHYYRVINETGFNNRPRFNGRDLSVAAINVQNVSPGLSSALYGNAPAIEGNEANPNSGNGQEMNGGNGNMAPSHEMDEGGDMADLETASQDNGMSDEVQNNAPSDASFEPVGSEKKRRVGRGRPRRRPTKEENIE